MKRRMCVVGLGLLVVGFIAAAMGYWVQAQRQVNDAYAMLKTEDAFVIGGVGITSRESFGEEQYDVILRQPRKRALGLFEGVYASGTTAAKAYALLGIHRLDKARFAELQRRGVSDAMVEEERGCLEYDKPLTQVAEEISGGVYGD